MMEKLLANPFTGDGTKNPDEHLIYVDEVCGLFKLAGVSGDVVKKKVFPLSLRGDASTWYRLCDDIATLDWNRLILQLMFIVIGIVYIVFGLVKDKVSFKPGGGLIT